MWLAMGACSSLIGPNSLACCERRMTCGCQYRSWKSSCTLSHRVRVLFLAMIIANPYHVQSNPSSHHDRYLPWSDYRNSFNSSRLWSSSAWQACLHTALAVICKSLMVMMEKLACAFQLEWGAPGQEDTLGSLIRWKPNGAGHDLRLDSSDFPGDEGHILA